MPGARKRKGSRSRGAAQAALRDWSSGRAYRDGAGNYRLRKVLYGEMWVGSGPVAWWNRVARVRWPSAAALHTAALGAQDDRAARRAVRGGPSIPWLERRVRRVLWTL